MSRLFPNPLVCPSCHEGDFRDMPGTIAIPATPPSTLSSTFATLEQMEATGTPLMKCPVCSRAHVPFGNIPGIVYHPQRQKWIVWVGARPFPGRRCDPNAGLVSDIEDALSLRFPPGSVDFVDPEKALYSKIPRFGHGSAGEQKTYPALPILAEYMDLVDLSRVGQPVSDDRGTIRYELPFFGLPPFPWTISSQNVVDVPDSHLEVWPNLPDWNAYWVFLGFFEDPKLLSRDLTRQWSPRFFGRTDRRDSLAPLRCPDFVQKELSAQSPPHGHVVSGWPEVISLSSAAQNAGGAFHVPVPQPQRNPNVNGSICLDFGTSRTVVMIEPMALGDPDTFEVFAKQRITGAGNFPASPTRFPDRLDLRPFDGARGRDVLTGSRHFRKSGSLVPTTSQLTYPEAGTVGPRVLLLRSCIAKASTGSAFRNDRAPEFTGGIPFIDYTITQQSMNELDLEFQAQKLSMRTGRTVNAAFLKAVLLMACAEHCASYGAANKAFAYSYPLAFSQDELTAFLETLASAGEWVNQCVPSAYRLVGLPTINGRPSDGGHLFPESQAAKDAGMVAGNARPGKVVVMADLGGGTLDLSMWMVDQNDRATALLSDSVRIGADRILNLFFRVFNREEGAQRDDRWKIYTKGYGELAKMFREDAAWRKTFVVGLNRWLGFQVEYLARDILGVHATGNFQTVLVLLAGGGWKVVEALGWGPDSLKERLEQKLRDRIQHLTDKKMPFSLEVSSILLQYGLEKVAVAGGLRNLGSGRAMEALGILAPNGVVEVDGSGQEHPWRRVVGKGGSQDGWTGMALKLSSDRNVVPNIPDLPPIPPDILRTIEGSIGADLGDDGRRLHTALAHVMEDIAMPRLVE